MSSSATRRLGKLPARHDARISTLDSKRDLLPEPPLFSNWYADISEVPMLGNDYWGDCVPCTVCHWHEQAWAYTHPNEFRRYATTAEALAIYSDVTGFDPKAGPPDSNPTDKGTYVLGPGGMIEHWVRNGVTVFGETHKLTSAASVNIKDLTQIRQAIWLYGSLMVGASLTQSDINSDFLWRRQTSSHIGGHEFLVVGYEQIAGEIYFDVVTWDGKRRMHQDWWMSAVDEALVVFNDLFFDARGLDAAGISKETLAASLQGFAP